MSDGRRLTLLRGNDLLSLEVELIDLAIEDGSGGPPVLAPTSAQARLIVHFPPQHLLEQAFADGVARPFVQARLAGPSRLVFRVPKRMPLTLATVLGWDGGKLPSVVPVPATPLTDRDTALELPFRLLLAPDRDARWRHRQSSPVGGSGGDRWYELWHTQLDAPGPDARVWIVAALQPGAADPLGAVSVNAGDRIELAKQSRRVTAAAGGTPDISVDRLLLSSLGASVDLSGAWSESTDLRPAWRHVASFGRDQYVRVTKRGFLRPFGHRASMTTVTERTFSQNGDAYLSQYNIVTVNEREKSYDGFADALREMPLRRVRIETTTTPRVSVASTGGPILQGGVPFPFQLTGFDWDNRPVTFSLPLNFEPMGASTDDADAGPPVRAALAGQALAFAKGASDATREATRLAAQSLDFASKPFEGDGLSTPAFAPIVTGARVSIPAVDQIFGGQKPVDVRLAETFRLNEFGQGNPAQLFLEMVDANQSLPAKAQQMGGMIAPNLNFVGVSRDLGAVSGVGATTEAALAKLQAGTFSPESFLGAGTKLFGSVLLTALLPETTFKPDVAGASDQIKVDQLLKDIEAIADTAAAADTVRETLEASTKLIKVPAMSTRATFDANGLPDGTEITYLWKPQVRKDLDKLIKTTDKTKLWLLVRMTARAGRSPEFRVEGHVTDFSVPIVKVMTVAFKRVRFRSAPGRALELKPVIGEVTFDGPLKFINSLQEILSAFGVDSPFDVKIQPTHLTATYSLGIPPFSLGVFGIENLRLFAGLKLPFVESAGPVAIRFALSERSAPFLVSYSLLAGGGFFSLELDTAGGIGIEAAIEIGGKFSFDVGVAKGGVYAMAGIYFSVKRSGSTREAHIQGYIRAGGFVDILGIAGVTIEFYVGLDYDLIANLLHGFAKVKACIEVLFFNECISFDVSYTIPGPDLDSANRPADAPFTLAAHVLDRPGQHAFTDLITPSDWDAYCAAFA